MTLVDILIGLCVLALFIGAVRSAFAPPHPAHDAGDSAHARADALTASIASTERRLQTQTRSED